MLIALEAEDKNAEKANNGDSRAAEQRNSGRRGEAAAGVALTVPQ